MRDSFLNDSSILSFPVPTQPTHQGNGDKAEREHSRTLHRVMRSAAEDTWVSLSNPGAFVAVLSDMLGQSASSVAVSLPPIGAQVAEPEQTPPPAKNAEAIALLRKWLADESGYDETVWPEIERAIEENRRNPPKG